LAAKSHLVSLSLGLVFIALGCADSRGGHIYRVPSSSMEPTLHCAKPALGCLADERDLVYAVPYGDTAPRRADIVVFQTPPAALQRCGASGLFIKRVIGLPGERWRERGGQMLIDGKTLAEPWLRPARRDSMSFPGGQIPPRRYLLLGDNRSSSCDSRFWGLVPLASIRGRVVEIKRGSKRIHLR
jgi:signal peptidase I